MSKSKRQLMAVIILLILLAAVSVGYVYAGKNKAEKEKEAEDTNISLSKLESDSISKLQFKTGSTDMSFSKQDGTWKYDEDSNFPVNESYMSKMAGDMADLSATRLVTKECTDLKQYGLESPQLIVSFTDATGNEKTFAMGTESTIASGCYAYLGDTKKVYIVQSEILEDFNHTKEQMMKVPDAPNINASNVKSYKLLKGKKTVIDNKVKDGDSNATVVYSGLANIIFTGGVSYKDDAGMFRKYGLDNPQYTVKIEYYETVSDGDKADTDGEADANNRTDRSLCMFIGDKAEDGSYYVRVDGTEGIYLLPNDAVQSLLDVSNK